MNIYRVDKEPVDARLHLVDGSCLEGTLFLARCSPVRPGSQTVADLMTEPGTFLRFRDAAGEFVLVGKAAIAAVSVAGETPAGFWNRASAGLRMVGAHRFDGTMLLEEGSGRRLSDGLEAPQVWIPLETDTPGLVWVSKQHIVFIQAREP